METLFLNIFIFRNQKIIEKSEKVHNDLEKF